MTDYYQDEDLDLQNPLYWYDLEPEEDISPEQL